MSQNPSSEITDLRHVPLFAGLSADQLRWLDGEGKEVRLGAGEALFTEGEGDPRFFVLLGGEVEITKRVGGEEVTLGIHRPGGFTGEIPLLTDSPYLASARATGPSRLLAFDRASFDRFFTECPPVTRPILRALAERMRGIEAAQQGQAKLAALGKLSAGLAHELNNPAAAARRAAGQLREAADLAQERALCLGGHGLDPAQLAALEDLRRSLAAGDGAPRLGGLDASDTEDEVADWLEDRGVPEGWTLAPTLVGAGLDPDRLDELAGRVPAAALADALAWLAAAAAAAELVGAVEQSAGRISDLVRSVKDYTYMDRAPVGDVDVHAGLESTLRMLGHELRGVEIARDYDPGLPRITAYGSELNQVWTNLIDNAADALGGQGTLRLRTRAEPGADRILVEVGDDGPGIPAEVRERIFEPFFTTKGVGEGTGLGLDIVRRIVVGRHRGEVRVESAPGDTRFGVRLPVGDARGET